MLIVFGKLPIIPTNNSELNPKMVLTKIQSGIVFYIIYRNIAIWE
jgi:hypothetical protein